MWTQELEAFHFYGLPLAALVHSLFISLDLSNLLHTFNVTTFLLPLENEPESETQTIKPKFKNMVLMIDSFTSLVLVVNKSPSQLVGRIQLLEFD